MINNHFKIIVPLFNTEEWVKYTINSIKKQKYQNFECVIINDMSTDNSKEIILKQIYNFEKIKFIDNQEKKYALRNIYDGTNYLNPQNEDVIVVLDGDDWFANDKVLDLLNENYQDDTLLTYGSYIEYPSGNKGVYSRELPEEVFTNNTFRNYPWSTSHLKTFKYKLWNNIKVEDLKDEFGNFFKMTSDLALMIPMLEMSGERTKYIDEILYVYNLKNPLNDHKIDNILQVKTENFIRNKERYKRL